MARTPEHGDLLIRQWGVGKFDLLDADTRACVAEVASLDRALAIAGRHPGAVWREMVDNRGRALGPPALLMLPLRT